MFLLSVDYRFCFSLYRYHFYFPHTLSPFHIRRTDTSCFFPYTAYIFCMSYSSHYARPSALCRRSPAGFPPTAKRFFIDQYRRISSQRIDFAERFRMFFLKPVNRSPWDSAFNQCAPSGQFFQSHYFLLSIELSKVTPLIISRDSFRIRSHSWTFLFFSGSSLISRVAMYADNSDSFKFSHSSFLPNHCIQLSRFTTCHHQSREVISC